MQTQNERLLDYLERHTAITPMEAWVKLGIYRLGARIFELRRLGHSIRSDFKKVPNQFGEECRVANYKLERAEQARAA